MTLKKAEALIKLTNVRELHQSDIKFVLNSFTSHIRKNKYKNQFLGWESKDVTKFLESMFVWVLSKPEFSFLVLCDRNNSEHIMAYIIAQPVKNTIFFNYTKQKYRNCGIQAHILMPLLISKDKTLINNWQTDITIKALKAGKCVINQDYLLELFQKDTEREINDTISAEDTNGTKEETSNIESPISE